MKGRALGIPILFLAWRLDLALGAQAAFKNLSVLCLSSQVLNYICVLCQLDTATVVWEEGTSTKTASPPGCPLGLVCGSFS